MATGIDRRGSGTGRSCACSFGACRGKSTGRWWSATVVCLASGPSLTADDRARVEQWKEAAPEERRVIAVCSTGLLTPWADVIYACDCRWFARYGDQLREFTGELWAAVGTNGQLREEWTMVADDIRERVKFIEVAGEEPGLSVHAGRINGGGNSGYQAIGLAYAWGARRIILLGYDMQRTGGKTHHHPDHGAGLPNPSDVNFEEWRAKMNRAAIDLRKQGVEVRNATRQTALKCFARVDLTEALR